LGGIFLGNLVLIGVDFDFTTQLTESPIFYYLRELGMIFLLFLVGLESNLSDLVKAGFNSTVTALIGVIIPTLGGFFIVKALGIGGNAEALLFGATFAATSVGITARMFSEAGKLKTPSAQVVLGAAVVDDVIGLVMLVVISDLARTNTFEVAALGWLLFKVLLFFTTAIFFGQFVLPHLLRGYRWVRQAGIVTVLAAVFALFFADLAHLVNLAPLVGAFTAGLLLDEVKFRYVAELKITHIEDVIRPLMDFLLPVFFVSIGVQVKLATLANPYNLLIIVVLLLVAIAGKAICGMACRGQGLDRLGIGFGMIPRGEVGLIFAQTGRSSGIISEEIYSILVFVVLLTTIVGPLFLKFRIKRF
jgi:Kef-type K+ transport system membrane component KefB